MALRLKHLAATVRRARRSARSTSVARVVDGEGRARGGGDAEAAHQRLRAVVAGAHADALAAEDLADVVRVGALERERDQRAAVGGVGRPVQREARRPRPGARARRRRARARGRGCAPCRSPGSSRPRRPARWPRRSARCRPRTSQGRSAQVRLGVADRCDHVAAADERRHRAPAARGGRAARRCRSARRPCGRSRRRSRRRARAGRRAAAAPPGRRRPRTIAPAAWARRDDLLDRVDRAEHVGDVRHGDQLGPAREQGVERVEVELAVVEHRHVGQLGARLGHSSCQGTMLEWCSISVSTTRSPGPTFWRAPACRRRG